MAQAAGWLVIKDSTLLSISGQLSLLAIVLLPLLPALSTILKMYVNLEGTILIITRGKVCSERSLLQIYSSPLCYAGFSPAAD